MFYYKRGESFAILDVVQKQIIDQILAENSVSFLGASKNYLAHIQRDGKIGQFYFLIHKIDNFDVYSKK